MARAVQNRGRVSEPSVPNGIPNRAYRKKVGKTSDKKYRTERTDYFRSVPKHVSAQRAPDTNWCLAVAVSEDVGIWGQAGYSAQRAPDANWRLAGAVSEDVGIWGPEGYWVVGRPSGRPRFFGARILQ